MNVHSQTRIICWDGLSFGVWEPVVPLLQQEFGKLKVEGVLWQYCCSSVSFTLEPCWFEITCPGTHSQEVEPSVGYSNGLVPRQRIKWTTVVPDFHYCWSPNWYPYCAWRMKFWRCVIRNPIHNGSTLEGIYLLDTEDWLLSWMWVLPPVVLLDSSVYNDVLPGGAYVSFPVIQNTPWVRREGMYKW